MSRQGTRYSPGEIKHLVEGLQELAALKDTDAGGLRALIAYADVVRALKTLKPGLRVTAFIRGVQSLHAKDAAVVLGITESAVRYRYEQALIHLCQFLNGGNA